MNRLFFLSYGLLSHPTPKQRFYRSLFPSYSNNALPLANILTDTLSASPPSPFSSFPSPSSPSSPLYPATLLPPSSPPSPFSSSPPLYVQVSDNPLKEGEDGSSSLLSASIPFMDDTFPSMENSSKLPPHSINKTEKGGRSLSFSTEKAILEAWKSFIIPPLPLHSLAARCFSIDSLQNISSDEETRVARFFYEIAQRNNILKGESMILELSFLQQLYGSAQLAFKGKLHQMLSKTLPNCGRAYIVASSEASHKTQKSLIKALALSCQAKLIYLNSSLFHSLQTKLLQNKEIHPEECSPSILLRCLHSYIEESQEPYIFVLEDRGSILSEFPDLCDDVTTMINDSNSSIFWVLLSASHPSWYAWSSTHFKPRPSTTPLEIPSVIATPFTIVKNNSLGRNPSSISQNRHLVDISPFTVSSLRNIHYPLHTFLPFSSPSNSSSAIFLSQLHSLPSESVFIPTILSFSNASSFFNQSEKNNNLSSETPSLKRNISTNIPFASLTSFPLSLVAILPPISPICLPFILLNATPSSPTDISFSPPSPSSSIGIETSMNQSILHGKNSPLPPSLQVVDAPSSLSIAQGALRFLKCLQIFNILHLKAPHDGPPAILWKKWQAEDKERDTLCHNIALLKMLSSYSGCTLPSLETLEGFLNKFIFSYKKALRIVTMAIKIEISLLGMQSFLTKIRLQSLQLALFNDENGRISMEKATQEHQEYILSKVENKHEKIIASNVMASHEIQSGYNSIGGLEEIKKILRECITYPLKYSHLYNEGLCKEAVKGILLFGPPGTGKTLLAKAIAAEGEATFLSVDTSLLEIMWLGETEKMAKAVFTLARKLSPCVIYLDEVDSLLSSRDGKDASSHGTLTSLKTTLMSEWDGLQTTKDHVIVIASTNRPYALDEAMLRRVPRRLLVDIPDKAAREAILRVILRKNRVSENVNYSKLADSMEGYTGSDIKEICREAVTRISHNKAALLEEEDEQKKNYSSLDSSSPIFKKTSLNAEISTKLREVTMDDLLLALRKLAPSVNRNSRDIERLYEWNRRYGEIARKPLKPHLWPADFAVYM